MRWNVRPLHLLDAELIARHRYQDGGSQRDLEAYATWVASRIQMGSYFGFVAELGGRIVAGAGVVLLDWGPTQGDVCPTTARIVNVYTEPMHRRHGMANDLVGRLLAACRDRGIMSCTLAAPEASSGMYAALGFEPYGEEMVRR